MSLLTFLIILFTLRGAVAVKAMESDKKIAFLFMARGPTPLEDVWREFFRWNADEKHYTIHIHVHKGHKIPATSFFHGKEISKENREGGDHLWGNMAQVRAIKKLVQYALEDPLVQWLTMISESCIPLTNFNTMRNSLLRFDKSIVNACDMGAGEMETETRWRKTLDEGGFQKKWWRKSGTWFALMREHATMFAEETKFEPYWEKVPCCDEHYLPSILAFYGQDNRTTCSDGFCHVHWPSLIAMHPHTYSGDEITPELFQHLSVPEGDRGFAKKCSGVEGQCHFTARKFGAASKYQLLENIDLILSDEDVTYEGNPWDHHQDKFRVTDDGKYFLIENGYLREIPDEETLKALHHQKGDKPTQKLTDIDSKAYPAGSAMPSRKDGELIKAKKSNWVFLIEGGHRRGIPNMETLLHLNMKLADVKVLPDTDMEQIVMGEPIPDVTKRNREGPGRGGHNKKKKSKIHELGEHDHIRPKAKARAYKDIAGREEEKGDSAGERLATTTDMPATDAPKGDSIVDSSATNTTTAASSASVTASTATDATEVSTKYLYQSEATARRGGKEDGEGEAHDTVDKTFWEARDYFKASTTDAPLPDQDKLNQ